MADGRVTDEPMREAPEAIRAGLAAPRREVRDHRRDDVALEGHAIQLGRPKDAMMAAPRAGFDQIKRRLETAGAAE